MIQKTLGEELIGYLQEGENICICPTYYSTGYLNFNYKDCQGKMCLYSGDIWQLPS